MNDLIKKEKRKYDELHRMSGYDPESAGYGRQLSLVRNSESLFFASIRESIDKDDILEIGIGAGEMTRWLIENTERSVSIDISEYAVESVKEIIPNSDNRILQASASELPFEQKKFKTVMHLDGMEHIPREIEFACLEQAIKVLTKDGRIYYANACCDAWWDHILLSKGYDEAHINIKTPEEWIQFYRFHSRKLGYEVEYHEVVNDTVYVILKKDAE